MQITYKRNGEEITKNFDSNLDLIEYVILQNVKDEELVSINLDGEEITGGINGLAIYALRQINDVREARKQALEDEGEYFDDSDAEEFEDDEYEELEEDEEQKENSIDELKDKIDEFEKFLDEHMSIFD